MPVWDFFFFYSSLLERSSERATLSSLDLRTEKISYLRRSRRPGGGWGWRARTANPLALRSPPRSCLGLTVTEDPAERTGPRGGPLSRQWHLFAASLSAQTDTLKNSSKWGFSMRTEIALSPQWSSGCGGHTFQCRSWPHRTFHSGGFYRGTALPRDKLPTNTPSFPFSLTIKAYGVEMGGWQEFLKHISTFFIAHTLFSLCSWGWEPGFSLSQLESYSSDSYEGWS